MSEEPSHAETVFSRKRKFTEEELMEETMKIINETDEERKARLAKRLPYFDALRAAHSKVKRLERYYTQDSYVNGNVITEEERQRRKRAYSDAVRKKQIVRRNLQDQGVPYDVMDEYVKTGYLPNWITN